MQVVINHDRWLGIFELRTTGEKMAEIVRPVLGHQPSAQRRLVAVRRQVAAEMLKPDLLTEPDLMARI